MELHAEPRLRAIGPNGSRKKLNAVVDVALAAQGIHDGQTAQAEA
jgi:hypothetical protein